MADEDEPKQAPRTFTQEEVNALMGQTRREERGKYADYEDLKAKAAKYDEAQEAAKTELERANERAAKAEAEAKALREAKQRADLAAKVAGEEGVPVGLVQGTTEAEMRASAQALAAWGRSQRAQAPADMGGAASKPAATKRSILAIEDAAERRRAIADNIELFTKQ